MYPLFSAYARQITGCMHPIGWRLALTSARGTCRARAVDHFLPGCLKKKWVHENVSFRMFTTASYTSVYIYSVLSLRIFHFPHACSSRLALFSIQQTDLTSFRKIEEVLNGYVTNPNPTLTLTELIKKSRGRFAGWKKVLTVLHGTACTIKSAWGRGWDIAIIMKPPIVKPLVMLQAFLDLL